MLDVARTLRVGEAEELMTIVVGDLDTIECEVGILSQQRSCKEERTTESFELGSRYLPGVVGVGLVELLGEVHRVIDVANVSECTFEQILGSINPTLTVKPCIWTHLIVRYRDGEGLIDTMCRCCHLSSNAARTLLNVFLFIMIY